MADIRLIASDIDGTILPFSGEISPATIQMITGCRARGILFVLASGRCYPEALRVAKEAGIAAPIICANGGCIHDEAGNIIYEHVMTPEESETAYQIIRDCGWMVTSYVRGKVLRLNTQSMKKVWPRTYPGFEFVENDPARMEREGHDRVYKYEVYANDTELLGRLGAELTEAGLSVSSSVPTDIEIMSKNAGKGDAVMWLAGTIGAKREQVMAFGDNMNDMQMLLATGWPVAMGNAVEELKSAARIIAPDASEDGVAKVVQRYAL